MKRWTWLALINFVQDLKNKVDLAEPNARFRIAAFDRVIKKIKQMTDLNALCSRIGIERLNFTPHMREKLTEAIKGPVVEVEPQSDIFETVGPPKVLLEQQLSAIPGLGHAKARELIDAGLKCFDDLMKARWFNKLPEASQAHLLHAPLTRIPHEKIKKIEPLLTAFDGTQLVGSYRREQPYSSDIDVMLVSDDPASLKRYLEHLREHFKVWVYSHGSAKMSLILAEKNKPLNVRDEAYKTDVFRCGTSEAPAMLLYSTGSKFFNIRMRNRAKRMGYLLNQNGLFEGKNRLHLPNEQAFFEILQMPWQEPRDRE